MDKIFVDEAVNELQTIQDMLRWSVSRFSAANIWYGHGTDNPWDEAVQLVLPSLYLPLDIPEDMRTARLTSSEKHRIVERVIRRVNERIPVAYLTNRAWFCGHEFYVDERVLVPRSPIGELINNKFAGLISKQPQHILDMCTGSGCIAIDASLYQKSDTLELVVQGDDVVSQYVLAARRRESDNVADVGIMMRHNVNIPMNGGSITLDKSAPGAVQLQAQPINLVGGVLQPGPFHGSVTLTATVR